MFFCLGIRNRSSQFEAIQHLVQLLPPSNRDTLYALLNFLSLVAQNATDVVDDTGWFTFILVILDSLTLNILLQVNVWVAIKWIPVI